ncbi:MAG: DNA/RNA nuclease SfsA [Chloroflexi bacterium]|nr:MAG: DNA/RNA nuclease SfsA [Chloroflexota bacterium]
MRFSFITEPATFLERPNRYLVVARLRNGTLIHAHCPDPGRLRELLLPGATIHVSSAANPARKTAYDLRFVEHPEHGQLISLDSRLPNQLFSEGLASGFFAPFRGYSHIAREVALPQTHAAGVRSRIDFRLVDARGGACWVEVKSATLVEAGVAKFPDAVTARGRRHVLELATMATSGQRCAIVFIVQRPDATRLQPQWERDPAFAKALVVAATAGVKIYAYTCTLTTAEMALAAPIPVEVAPPADTGRSWASQ